MSNNVSSARKLFICGCARSGTSALAAALNGRSEIVLGLERYISYLAAHGALSPDLFERDRFFDVRSGDTFYDDLGFFEKHYAHARDKFAAAKYVGDKIPALTDYLPKIINDFPDARVICIVRNLIDVCASFENRARTGRYWPKSRDADAAIGQWNRALGHVAAQAHLPNVLVVIYEDLFVKGTGWDRVSAFLDLDVPPPALHPRKEMIDVLSPKTKTNILVEARLQLYREILTKHGAKPAAPGSAAAPKKPQDASLRKYESDPPLSNILTPPCKGCRFRCDACAARRLRSKPTPAFWARRQVLAVSYRRPTSISSPIG